VAKDETAGTPPEAATETEAATEAYHDEHDNSPTKLSHVSKVEVTKTIEWLKSIYVKDMRVSRGKKYDYLGMDLYFTADGKVKITMRDYLQDVLEYFLEIIFKTAATPAADHLFTIRPEVECDPLDEAHAMAFHHSVAELLIASTRERKDSQPTIAFLMIRVHNMDEDDWGKLRRLIPYIKGTINLPLVLRADSLTVVNWWVDA
jgi:hypothetical protein